VKKCKFLKIHSKTTVFIYRPQHLAVTWPPDGKGKRKKVFIYSLLPATCLKSNK